MTDVSAAYSRRTRHYFASGTAGTPCRSPKSTRTPSSPSRTTCRGAASTRSSAAANRCVRVTSSAWSARTTAPRSSSTGITVLRWPQRCGAPPRCPDAYLPCEVPRASNGCAARRQPALPPPQDTDTRAWSAELSSADAGTRDKSRGQGGGRPRGHPACLYEGPKFTRRSTWAK